MDSLTKTSYAENNFVFVIVTVELVSPYYILYLVYDMDNWYIHCFIWNVIIMHALVWNGV